MQAVDSMVATTPRRARTFNRSGSGEPTTLGSAPVKQESLGRRPCSEVKKVQFDAVVDALSGVNLDDDKSEEEPYSTDRHIKKFSETVLSFYLADKRDAYFPQKVLPKRPRMASPDTENPPKPSNEAFRLKVLRSLDLLQTREEKRFRRVATAASEHFEMPICLITLVEEEQQHVKASYGLENHGLVGACDLPRSDAVCGYILLPSSEPCLVVEDLTVDPRFSNANIVVGPPHFKSYFGAPLLTSDGVILGALCLLDFKVRKFNKDDKEWLLALAHLTAMELERERRREVLLKLKEDALQSQETSPILALDSDLEGLMVLEASAQGLRVVYVNEDWEKMTGYSMVDAYGRICTELLERSDPKSETEKKLSRSFSLDSRGSLSVNMLNYRKDGSVFRNWLRLRPIFTPATNEHDTGEVSCEDEAHTKYYLGVMTKARAIM